MSLSDLIDKCQEIGTHFLGLSKKRSIRIYCHQDSDGICAASILARALQKKHYKFQIHAMHFLTATFIDDLKANIEEDDVLVFVDIGSSYLSLLKNHFLPNQHIIVIDHHLLEDTDRLPPNLIQLNPYEFGIDGSAEACASSLIFFICREITTSPQTDSFALLGILGDYQDVGRQHALTGLNNEVLSILKKEKAVSETMDLWFTGGQNRTTIQILEMLKLGDENNSNLRLVSRVLKETGISPYVQFSVLTKDEKRDLASKLAEFHVGIDEFIRYVFTFEKETNTFLRDVMSVTETFEGLIQTKGTGAAFSIVLGDRKTALTEFNEFRSVFTHKIAESIEWANQSVEKKQATFYLDVDARFNLATAQSSASILLDKCDLPLVSSIKLTEGYFIILFLVPRNLRRIGMNAFEVLKEAHEINSLDHYDLTGAKEIARTIIQKPDLTKFLQMLDNQVYKFIRESFG